MGYHDFRGLEPDSTYGVVGPAFFCIHCVYFYLSFKTRLKSMVDFCQIRNSDFISLLIVERDFYCRKLQKFLLWFLFPILQKQKLKRQF